MVPAGTPGAVQDGIFGSWWITRASKGLNGGSGFIQAEHSPILNDSSEVLFSLPPVGSDGVDNRDRLYYFAGSPGGIDYMPGDEWIEVIRDRDDLVQSVTPVSEQSAPEQIQLTARDATAVLRKTREFSSGYWNHAPRDVFEHYTRAWQSPIAEDFMSQSNFPAWSDSTNVSVDGQWQYAGVKAIASGLLTLAPVASGWPFVLWQGGLPEAGPVDHSCWRIETAIVNTSVSAAVPLLMLGVYNAATNNYPITLIISPVAGQVTVRTINWINISPNYYYEYWPTNASGLLDGALQLQPPYTMAIEARERWVYFYVNGQQVAVVPRHWPDTGNPGAAGSLRPFVQAAINVGDTVAVDYFVVRKTTKALNGGTPGDYMLPSAPSPGGLQGTYYDLSQYKLTKTSDLSGAALSVNVPTLRPAADPTVPPGAVRVDGGVYFTVPVGPTTPGWFPSAAGNAKNAYVRWCGSIYLPLATQDVVFQIPGTQAWQALYVGKTRRGEAICVVGGARNAQEAWPGETLASTSVGMRSWLGTSVSGWYPLVFEFRWDTAMISTTTDICGFTYNVGGTGSVPSPYVLSPYGCFTGQVADGDSHFDTIQTTLGQQFGINWRSEPRKLESGWFPGAIVPKVRVGRDTDLQFTDEQATNPQETSTAEDNATVGRAQAQGLGSSSGSTTAEVFNTPVLSAHPFLLTEMESLTSITNLQLLILQLETLLELRSNVYQTVTADSSGARSMQDSWPLSGSLAEFDWMPGDALRINLPQIGVVDDAPRQIMALKRTLYQDGMGINSASFQGRPRDFMHTMRKFVRQVYGARRTFQGQLVAVNGNRTQVGGASSAPLPPDLSLVRQALLTVANVNIVSLPLMVSVNGTPNGQQVLSSGVVDVSNWIGRHNSVQPEMQVSLTSTDGAIADYVLTLYVLVRTPR